MGLPHALSITTTDVTDRQGAVEMIGQNVKNLSEVKKFSAGGGYSGESFAQTVKNLCAAEAGVVKRYELHAFAAPPKWWVIDRKKFWVDGRAGFRKIAGGNHTILSKWLFWRLSLFLSKRF
jgi:hypothetical protein